MTGAGLSIRKHNYVLQQVHLFGILPKGITNEATIRQIQNARLSTRQIAWTLFNAMENKPTNRRVVDGNCSEIKES